MLNWMVNDAVCFRQSSFRPFTYFYIIVIITSLTMRQDILHNFHSLIPLVTMVPLPPSSISSSFLFINCQDCSLFQSLSHFDDMKTLFLSRAIFSFLTDGKRRTEKRFLKLPRTVVFISCSWAFRTSIRFERSVLTTIVVCFSFVWCCLRVLSLIYIHT